jgi:DNA-binding transcriptional LysR family regulator
MTQPPLTQAIQQLERRLGVMLFERTRRAVALTPAGAALVVPVKALLAQADALPALARAAGEGEVGRLRLAFVSTVGFDPLPRWLRAFREAEPRVNVALREATTDVQLAAFEAGEIDAGFVLHAPGMAPPGYERLLVRREPLVLALPEAHPLASATRLSLKALLAEPLVIFPRGIAASLYDAVLAFYHHHGAAPAIAQEAIQMQTIVNLVSAGLGLAWVPEVVTELQRTGVTYRPLPASLAGGAPRCETSLVWREPAPPALQRFIDFIRAQPER